MTDREAIALTLWGEARGERTEGRIAVACVLKNRRLDGRWGSTYQGVALAPKQFSCWNTNDPNAATLRQMQGQFERGEAVTLDPTLKECFWIAEGLLAEAILPRVGRSTHYFATTMPHEPSWAKTGLFYGIIGRHAFYAGVR